MIDCATISSIESDIYHCTKCDLVGRMNPHPFSHYLDLNNKDVKFLFVGRNPGLEHAYPKDISFDEYRALYQDNFIKSNFGKYLIASVGLDVVKASMFTNAVKCPTFNNEEPPTANFTKCMPHLFRQIEAANPKKIFVFGRTILRSLAIACGAASHPVLQYTYGGFNKMDVIKYVTPEKSEIRYSFMLLYHPSYFQRGGSAELGKRQVAFLQKECAS